ncbi:MAG: hypothetical protein L0H31_10500, partial [Nocardioidaceae bacterium]|nr:hypothetical protein [Nocardioidaceae bacterium]
MSDLLVSVKTLDGYDRAAELAPTAIEAGDVEALLSACQMHVGLTDDEVTKRFLDAAEAVVLE